MLQSHFEAHSHLDLEEEAIFKHGVSPIARIHHLNSVPSPQICFEIGI